MQCISCKKEIEDAKFCPYCGTKQEAPKVEESIEPVKVEAPVQETEKQGLPPVEPTTKQEEKVIVPQEDNKPKERSGLHEYAKDPFSRSPLNGWVGLTILLINIICSIALLYALVSSITVTIMNAINSYIYGGYFPNTSTQEVLGTMDIDFVTYCLAGSVLALSSFVFFYLEELVLNVKEAKDAFGRACGKLFLPTVLDICAVVFFFVNMDIGIVFVALSTLTKILAVSRIGKNQQNGYVSILVVILYIAFIAVVLRTVFFI